MKAAPLDPQYEKPPASPLSFSYVPPGSIPYHVKDGDDWKGLASLCGADVWQLIEFNFKTRDPKEVNWYLRERVGCNVATPDRKNWKFSSSANPGVVHLPETAGPSVLSKALMRCWFGVGGGLSFHAGFVGARLMLARMYNVEALAHGMPVDFSAGITFVSTGAAFELSRRSVIVIVTGLDPAKLRAYYKTKFTGTQVKLLLSSRSRTEQQLASVLAEAKEALRNPAGRPPGALFSRDQVLDWLKRLGTNPHARQPRVHIIVRKRSGIEIGATIGVGAVHVLA